MKKKSLSFTLCTVITVLCLSLPNFILAQDIQSQAVKFAKVVRLVEAFYVDTANIEKMTENAIIDMLGRLDPHSVYISKSEVEEMNQPLEGNFEGIGISFSVIQDTLTVMTTIPGGPSEKVGLHPGDRIVRVGSKNITNIGLKTQDVYGLLRGNKGTIVNLTIFRRGISELLDFTIIRDKIPIYSLDAAFLLNNETAFIKLNRFSATTIDEYTSAMKKLEKEGRIKNLVLDLRGNGGGYLGAAYELANKFLEANKLIVYTEGIHSPRKDYRSNTNGDFLKGNLIILIDEGTASASEIVSGAIQDWDRGVLIGRRSFGKGLVQQQFELNDGSMIRLTTAHYFTPAGRNIQKPYKDHPENYRNDYLDRYERGELFNKDSIPNADSLMTKTLVTKRKVFGGGGIVPDIFVPLDTSVHYTYFNTLVRKNIFFPYVVSYIDQHRNELLAKYPDFQSFRDKYAGSPAMLDELMALGEKSGVKKDEESVKILQNVIFRQIRALIARDLYDPGTYFRIMTEDDPEVKKAVELLSDPKAYARYLNR
ncbi:MAG TPA: S41 family peptidase [Prolixibacteraceae bacterium]|nr:S41 family peptidase [Prolixibacteraceae bacterium]